MQTVLVVGAGPTGLTLALKLAESGVNARIIDSKTGPTPESRALAVHARTLESLGRDRAMELIARGRKIFGAAIHADEPLTEISLQGSSTAYPFVLGLSQSETERVLIDALGTFGIEVEWETTLSTLQQSDAGCHATFADQSTASFDWVVGCDGVNSVTRTAGNIEVDVHRDETWWQLADVVLEGDVPPPDKMSVWLTSRGPMGLIPIERAGYWRVIAPGSKGPERPDTTLAAINDLLSERATVPLTAKDDIWLSSFRIREQIAGRYRSGRIFIAGDAAHAHSPVGGQGMNTGIQDAVNLAWKLALVARGESDSKLLDSYEEERRPVGERLVATTSSGTKAMYVSQSWLIWMRNTMVKHLTAFDAMTDRIANNIEMLNIAYPSSSIVGSSRDRIANEQPDFSSRREFANAMGPGERAPLELHPILDVCSEPRHVVLLFDGNESSEEGYLRMRETLDALRLTEHFDAYVVVPQSAIEQFDADDAIIDASGDIHDAFGVQTEAMVVIRPDGYIGFRSQPVDLNGLNAWWEHCTGG